MHLNNTKTRNNLKLSGLYFKINKSNQLLIMYAILLMLFSGYTLHSQTRMRQIHLHKATSFLDTNVLEGNLLHLNLCGERPDDIQEIYKTAFNTLHADSNSTFNDLAKNLNFLKLCRENGITHSGGPMLGNISSEGASVWIRTLKPAKVEVRINVDGTVKTYGPVLSSENTDMTAIVYVKDLKAETSYAYNVFIDGKPINVDVQPYITTTPLEHLPSNARIAFGTCYHRWGLCNQTLSHQIISREPLALLLGGDIAAQDRRNHIGLHRADYLLRDFHPAWKNMVSSLPVYATWDDHDYFDNDQYNIPGESARGSMEVHYTLEDKEAVSDIFRASWNNPPYGSGEGGKGVFFRTRIGPADVIMLDNRYFREKGNFLGDQQMEWLKEQLLDCEGPFIILSNGTMWSDYVSGGKDSWGVYDPEGREEIFKLIEENNIGGVLLISGDRHGARGFRIPRPSGFNFYEFEVASLGARVGPPPIRADWDTQLFGISGEYAFGEFDFDATLTDPEVTFRLIHENGAVLYELTLTKSQLTP